MIERPAIRVLEDIIADLDEIPSDQRKIVSNLSAFEVISGLWNAFLFGASNEEEDNIVIEGWGSILGQVLASGGVALAAGLLIIGGVEQWSWSNVLGVSVGLISGLSSLMNSITGLRSTKRMHARKRE
jgi:hypothetical protein